MACELESIGDVGSVSERVQMLAPWINDQLLKFASGELAIGVRTFQAQVPKAVVDAHLSEEIYNNIAKVGVHPDKREGCMVVPIDVHDLLIRIVSDGWDEMLVDALGCKMPPPMAAEWRSKNVTLTENSCGVACAVRRWPSRYCD